MTEKQKYEVVEQFDGIELRHYPACQVASVQVRGDLESAGSRGFRPLVTYISGANRGSKQIAMTAPVIQQQLHDDIYEVSFVMPSGFELEDLPVPADSKVKLETIPEHFALAYRFAGTWTENRFIEAETLLRNAQQELVANQRLSASVSNEVYIARYDPPWKPGFLRRNEVLMKVTRNQ